MKGKYRLGNKKYRILKGKYRILTERYRILKGEYGILNQKYRILAFFLIKLGDRYLVQKNGEKHSKKRHL